MYIISNAIKNFARYKSRIILNFVILFLIATVCSITFVLITSCSAAMRAIEDNLSARYMISGKFGYYPGMGTDNDFIYKVFDTMNSKFIYNKADKEDMLKLFDTPYIDDFILTDSINIQINEFYGDQHADRYSYADIFDSEGNYLYTLSDISSYLQTAVSLEGYYDLNIDDVTEFKYGINEIKEGRFAEKDNEIVISDMLAEASGVKVGDVVTPVELPETKLTVVGIYTTLHDVYEQHYLDGIGLRGMDNQSGLKMMNVIYTSFDTVYNLLQEIGSTISNEVTIDGGGKSTYLDFYPVFIINNEENVANVNEYVQTLNLPAPVTVSYDRETGEMLTKKLGDFNTTLFIAYLLCMAIGGLVILLFTALFYNSRRFETAVLYTMGMSRIKIICGLFIENFIFIVGTLLAGLLAARFVAPIVLERYLGESIAWFDIHVMITGDFLLQYGLFAGGLLLVTTLIFALTMVKYSPLKLLTEAK